MGAFQRERHPCRTRVCSRRTIRTLSIARKNRPAASTDGGIRLINISVDSGPDSFRDEELTKFRVTKEGRKRGRKTGMEGALRKFGTVPLLPQLRCRRETILKTSMSAYIKVYEYIGTRGDFVLQWDFKFCPLLLLFIHLAFFTNIIFSYWYLLVFFYTNFIGILKTFSYKICFDRERM